VECVITTPPATVHTITIPKLIRRIKDILDLLVNLVNNILSPRRAAMQVRAWERC
jgi:transcriptional regulator with AAA-type ATPase domain